MELKWSSEEPMTRACLDTGVVFEFDSWPLPNAASFGV